MPLYEYECNDCEHRFERIQKFSDPLVSTCPVCGGEVRKLLSLAGHPVQGDRVVCDRLREEAQWRPAERCGR